MSRFLLDTNTLIDYSKRREPSTSKIINMLDEGEEIGVCDIVIAEFMAGIPPEKREYWVTALSTLAYWELSPLGAGRAGQWIFEFQKEGQRLSVMDTLIAALAIEKQAILVTSNTKDYPMPDIQLLNIRTTIDPSPSSKNVE